MNIDKAKIILHIYRADPAKDDDPEVKEALALAASDPELMSWFESEQSFDRALAGKLCSIEPPPDLKGKILAEMPIFSTESDTVPGIVADVIWWRRPLAMSLSVAACLVLLLGVGTLLLKQSGPGQQKVQQPQSTDTMARYLQRVANHADHMDGFDFRHENIAKLRSYLSERETPFPVSLPAQLEKMPGMGCVSFTWEGRKVGLICFKGDKVYHLFVTDRDHFPSQKEIAKPVIRQIGKYGTATWTNDLQLYILTAEGRGEDLRRFL